MKHEGQLPTPSLSATIHILPADAPRNARADVVVSGAPPRVKQVTRRGTHHCSVCGGAGHNRRSFDCPMADVPR